MPADASIFAQYLQPVRSVQDYGADMDRRDLNALQLVAARRQNELAGLQADQTREQLGQAQAKRNALAALYADPAMADPVARENAMLRNPLLAAEGQAAQKARLDASHVQAQAANQNALAGKNAAEQAAAEFKARIDKANQALKDIAGFQHPGEALADLQAKMQEGHIKPEQAQVIAQQLQGIQTPEQWAQWQQMTRYRILDAKDQLEQDWKAKAEQRAAADAAAVNANRDLVPDGRGGWRVNTPLVQAKTQIAAAGAAQPPGMTYMADASGNIVGLPTKAPMGKPVVANVVTDPNRQPVPGKDAGLNDSQSKALLFGSRMQEAHRILSEMASSGVDRPGAVKSAAAGVPLVGDALGVALNATQSPQQQQVEQAQRDFINAVLRRESGAAISPGEFSSAEKQYFPQIGDSPAVKAQKERNRSLAIRGLLAEVPQNKRGSIAPAGAGGAPAPAQAPQVVDFSSLK